MRTLFGSRSLSNRHSIERRNAMRQVVLSSRDTHCEEPGASACERRAKQRERRGRGRGTARRNCKGVHMTNDTNANTTPGARPSAVGQTHRGDEETPIMGHPFLQGGFAPIQQE